MLHILPQLNWPLTHRRMVKVIILPAIILACFIVLINTPQPARAVDFGVRIDEVMTGLNGNSNIQFVKLEAEDSAHKCWGAQHSGDACYTGIDEITGRMMLVFMNASGVQTGRYVIPTNPGGTFNTVLFATQAFANLPGAPIPDYILPKEVNSISGQVCLRGNPDNPNAPSLNLCLSYGSFTGPQQNNAAPGDPVSGPFTGSPNGTPVAGDLAVTLTNSVKRLTNTFDDQHNSDFSQTNTPNPRNTANQTVTFQLASQQDRGKALFFNETWGGNGRTCLTCHKPKDFFGLSPVTVASLPPTDPLFMAEFNLNTLVLSAASFPSDLRGALTASDGSNLTVIAGTLNTFQVYGGNSSLVGQTVTDTSGNSGVISTFTAGTLNGLEDSRLMDGGRALILLNIDGFSQPSVERTSPNLLNLIQTRPYGLSGNFPSVTSQATAAVQQHFPRNLSRVAGTDFRLPTLDELNDLNLFMDTILMPKDGNFDLNRVVTTEAQKRGRALFFSTFDTGFNCDTCHDDDQVMSGLLNFNTNVQRQEINDRFHDNLPREPASGPLRQFNVTQLWGVRFTAPYFHDNSVFTLREAVEFYNTRFFQQGPDGFLVNPVFFEDPQNVTDVVAFLEALVDPVDTFTRSLDFGGQPTGDGPTASQTISVTNVTTDTLAITGVFLDDAGAENYVITSVPASDPFGPGATQTIQVAFDPDVTGLITATLEFTATNPNADGFASGVVLSGTGLNSPPTISPISDQTTNEDTPTAAIPFTIGDPDTPTSNLTLSASSSNPALVPLANIIFDGPDASRTVTITPALNQNGSTTITITVSDGQLSAGTTFQLSTVPVNDAPAFTPGPDQAALDTAGPQTVTGWATDISPGPADEAGQTLTFILTNDTPGLFTMQPMLDPFGTLSFTPLTGTIGIAHVTVELQDNGGTANGGQDTSNPVTFNISIGVNHAPSFTAGSNQTRLEDAGAQTVTAWATNISPGPPNEAGQALNFIVTNDNNGLFSTQPAISSDGTLTFTSAADANGSANITVILHDDGGTANGGSDSSAPVSFTISITPVNDRPSFTVNTLQVVLEDAGLQTVTAWATNINPGAANESSQVLNFILTNDNNPLFSVQPAISADGTLTFIPSANRSGKATVTATLHDDGGTANGGQDTSLAATFTIRITAVNDPPSFTPGPDQVVPINAGAQTVTGWATNISPGPLENNQTVTFTVINPNPGLFSVQPAISPTGTLTYTPATNVTGSVTLTVTLKDNGGTANGGVDTSSPTNFSITITN